MDEPVMGIFLKASLSQYLEGVSCESVSTDSGLVNVFLGLNISLRYDLVISEPMHFMVGESKILYLSVLNRLRDNKIPVHFFSRESKETLDDLFGDYDTSWCSYEGKDESLFGLSEYVGNLLNVRCKLPEIMV